jgi:hypothetical protein
MVGTDHVMPDFPGFQWLLCEFPNTLLGYRSTDEYMRFSICQCCVAVEVQKGRVGQGTCR